MIRKTALLLALLLALCAAFPALAEDAAGIPGYSRSAGYTYVTFGSYPTDADGTVRPIIWRVLKNEYLFFLSTAEDDSFAGGER